MLKIKGPDSSEIGAALCFACSVCGKYEFRTHHIGIHYIYTTHKIGDLILVLTGGLENWVKVNVVLLKARS